MACINSQGYLTKSAKRLLESLTKKEQTAEQIARELGVPLFKVRSFLREMESLGFVAKTGDIYAITGKGKTVLLKQS